MNSTTREVSRKADVFDYFPAQYVNQTESGPHIRNF
jgi:hypothetical protein